jgi:hypothetical protein
VGAEDKLPERRSDAHVAINNQRLKSRRGRRSYNIGSLKWWAIDLTGGRPTSVFLSGLKWVAKMARYEHLPRYRDALNLAVHFEKMVAGFSPYHKYTLGTEQRRVRR